MAIDWDRLRLEEFPVANNWAYFDHAAVAPIPRRSGNVLRAWAAEQESHGCVNWPDWGRKVETLREDLARLINSGRDEIALVASTTHGLGLISEGFPWNRGDSVVTAADEFPSNLYPWMNLADRGVKVRQVPSRDGRVVLDDLVSAVDSTTKLLAISHVEFATGYRNDLDALASFCQPRGIALCVDGIQGVGPHVVNVAETPIDFLAADGHKWLLGPEGAGFLYVRRAWIDRLRPIGVGWHSVVGTFNSAEADFRLKPDASRWEGGSFNMPGLLAFGASVGLLLELGPEAVSQRILNRAEKVRDIAAEAGWYEFGPKDAQERSAIVALDRPGTDPTRLARELRNRGIVVSTRRGHLRISPHIYNDESDLDRLRSGLLSV